MPTPSEPAIIYFVRHGESHSNTENRIQGHSDSGLSDRGIRQASKLAKRLSRAGIQKIICSDLGRAKNTAKIIAGQIRKKIHLNSSLREIHLGDWEGLTTDEVDQAYARGYQRWLKSPTKMKIPGAETVPQFHKRVRTVAESLFDQHPGGPTLVVTHGGVIASLLSYWLRADFDYVLLNLRVDNTSVTAVERNAFRHKIHCLNDVSHLSAKDLSRKNIFTER